MSKNIKLVVCNEPQNCQLVKELEAERDRFKQREIELSKGWKRLHSENEDLRARLAEAEKILDKFFKTPADKWIVTEKYGLLYALGEVRDALRGETEGK